MYIGIATSKASALSINVSLIFEMHLTNGVLLLKEIPLIRLLESLATLFAALTAAFLAAFLSVVLALASGKSVSEKRASGKRASGK